MCAPRNIWQVLTKGAFTTIQWTFLMQLLDIHPPKLKVDHKPSEWSCPAMTPLGELGRSSAEVKKIAPLGKHCATTRLFLFGRKFYHLDTDSRPSITGFRQVTVFRREVSSSAVQPVVVMTWILEVHRAKSPEDVSWSTSVTGVTATDFETLVLVVCAVSTHFCSVESMVRSCRNHGDRSALFRAEE